MKSSVPLLASWDLDTPSALSVRGGSEMTTAAEVFDLGVGDLFFGKLLKEPKPVDVIGLGVFVALGVGGRLGDFLSPFLYVEQVSIELRPSLDSGSDSTASMKTPVTELQHFSESLGDTLSCLLVAGLDFARRLRVNGFPSGPIFNRLAVAEIRNALFVFTELYMGFSFPCMSSSLISLTSLGSK